MSSTSEARRYFRTHFHSSQISEFETTLEELFSNCVPKGLIVELTNILELAEKHDPLYGYIHLCCKLTSYLFAALLDTEKNAKDASPFVENICRSLQRSCKQFVSLFLVCL